MIVGLQPAALFGEDELDINVRKRLQVQLVQLRGQLRLGQGVDDFRRTIDEAMEGGDTCPVESVCWSGIWLPRSNEVAA
jgi:hypothetical protein